MESTTQYKVGVAGLDPRDRRLVGIVFRHSQYNRHRFVLADDASPAGIDVLLANPYDPAGVRAMALARTCGREIPTVIAMPRGTVGAARHSIAIERLSLQLLPVLNRLLDADPGRVVPPLRPIGPAAPYPSGPGAVPTAGPAAPDPRTAGATTPVRRVASSVSSAAGVCAPRLRVLAVDDSPTVRRQLSLALERIGLDCVTEHSAESAIERLATEHVDLVLLDVELPDADGFTLARTLRRDRRLRRIPVLILSSRASPLDLMKGALAGCDGYLAKPVPLQALRDAVLRHARKSVAIDDLSDLVQVRAPGAPEAIEDTVAAATRRRLSPA